MARWKRTPIDLKAKIIEEKINNVDSSNRDIEEKTWVPHETVAKVLRDEFAQVCTNSPVVSDLVTRNNNLQSAADALIAEMIANKDESITIAQLATIRESTFKQNQLIEWKSTENNKVTIEWSV